MLGHSAFAKGDAAQDVIFPNFWAALGLGVCRVEVRCTVITGRNRTLSALPCQSGDKPGVGA